MSTAQGQGEAVIALHDQGLDTDTVASRAHLPWFLTTTILKKRGRIIRPRKIAGKRYGRK